MHIYIYIHIHTHTYTYTYTYTHVHKCIMHELRLKRRLIVSLDAMLADLAGADAARRLLALEDERDNINDNKQHKIDTDTTEKRQVV